ncbi:hypothetical protein A0128_14440 [Leptospira tipperaryensis]|uniref:Uncharacterized protein n=1 Tax=Leptospira tipperaryensis TaxID=2564040 RepID=A0A1D7UZD4_9LEPT|nr:hypothetical protein A0128_14440 [Leptospira tipperaryensis]
MKILFFSEERLQSDFPFSLKEECVLYLRCAASRRRTCKENTRSRFDGFAFRFGMARADLSFL